jgi:hypothetical protein
MMRLLLLTAPMASALSGTVITNYLMDDSDDGDDVDGVDDVDDVDDDNDVEKKF